MDPIRPSEASALIDALRQLGKASSSKSSGRTEGGQPKQGLPDAIVEQPGLREELRTLVAAVDTDDDAAVVAIRLPMLRCILLRQWGGAAANDQAFIGMVAAIDRTISADSRLAELVRHAIRALKE
ncbi:hypothetical protein [Dyella silvatica]|uniref:hypothetical protein n=1 Tax=Dyella silvatica TaxID=2992128 RepID=UPI002251AA14|nr:hypothetical protein [Dyella silvatica]